MEGTEPLHELHRGFADDRDRRDRPPRRRLGVEDIPGDVTGPPRFTIASQLMDSSPAGHVARAPDGERGDLQRRIFFDDLHSQ